MRMHDRSPDHAVPTPGVPSHGVPAHGVLAPEALEADLLGLIEESREQAAEDPFRNPVLAVTLATPAA